MPKNVRRTFTACWTCRKRRVRCDGRKPSCSPCTKRQMTCEGYHIELVWVNKETGDYSSRKRRLLNPEVVCLPLQSYDEEQLNHLLEYQEAGKRCACALHVTHLIPFNLIPVKSPTPRPLQSFSNLSVGPMTHKPAYELELFHHYVNHISYLMVPIDDYRNPWKSVYPAAALQSSSVAAGSLYYALLSQAAFNISSTHIRGSDNALRYRSLGLKLYGAALKQLQNALRKPTQDFAACIAIFFTLTCIEGSYSTDIRPWRSHFEGAAALIRQNLESAPWESSDDTWVICQSLAISFEIAQTGRLDPVGPSIFTDILLKSVAAKESFGHTIGGCSRIIDSISRIRLIGERMKEESLSETLRMANECLVDLESDHSPRTSQKNSPEYLFSTVQTSAADDLESPTSYKLHELRDLQLRMFENATQIYLRRTIFNMTPTAVSVYITSVLCDMIRFLNLGGGSISVWPIFIAAVEAHTPTQLQMVEEWLAYSSALGIPGRALLSKVIREVWRRRDQLSIAFTTIRANTLDQFDAPVELEKATEKGNIIVEWRQVQKDMRIDLQLL